MGDYWGLWRGRREWEGLRRICFLIACDRNLASKGVMENRKAIRELYLCPSQSSCTFGYGTIEEHGMAVILRSDSRISDLSRMR